MKLFRYGPVGQERPGILDDQGRRRSLAGIVEDLSGEAIDPAALRSLREIDVGALPLVDQSERLGSCVAGVGKFVCIGLNYADHALETRDSIPPEPVVFLKATSAIVGPNDDIEIPRGSTKTDWEVELGIVIGRTAKYVPEESALDYVAGYCTIMDVSERDYQFRAGGQWDKGKGCDTFGPIGPYLVTPDEVPRLSDLGLWLDVDGRRFQSGTTGDMIFDPATLISYLSQFFSLHPGDIVATGTPPGIGHAQVPEPIYLRPGQVVHLGVGHLGEQTHHVR